MRPIDADALPISFDGHSVSVWKVDIDNAPTLDYKDLVPQGEWIAELLKAEAEKRLVVLPCKVGCRIYRIVPDRSVDWPDPPKYKTIWDNFKLSDVNNFGKTVFLTEEEAKAALKEVNA